MNRRRHSMSVLPSFNSPQQTGSNGLLPPYRTSNISGWGMLSEEDLPTLSKLKKYKKKQQRQSSAIDLRLSSPSEAEEYNETTKEGYVNKRGNSKQRRNSVMVLPGVSLLQTSKLSNSAIEISGLKRKKKSKRKLSFAGFLPFLFDKSRRRKSSTEFENSDEENEFKDHRRSSVYSTDSNNSYQNNRNHETYDNENQSSSTIDENRINSSFHNNNKSPYKRQISASFYIEEDTKSIDSLRSSEHRVHFANEDTDTIKGQSEEEDRLSSHDISSDHGVESDNELGSYNCDDFVFNEYVPNGLENGYQHDKICHHGDCLDRNSGLPLILCPDCDTAVHSSPSSSSHIRFDLNKQSGGVRGSASRLRHASSHSLPETTLPPGSCSSDTEVELQSASRDQADDYDDVDGEIVRNTRLHRKKAVKVRRHNTEENKRALEAVSSMIRQRSHSWEDVPQSRNHDTKRASYHSVGSSDPESDEEEYPLNHVDSGIILNSGESLLVRDSHIAKDSPRPHSLVYNAASLPPTFNPPPSPAYVYSDHRNMPILEPSPTTPMDGNFGRRGVLILQEPGESSTDKPLVPDTPNYSSTLQPPAFYKKRDGAGSQTKKSKADGGIPHSFTRKHSMPAMLISSSGNKTAEKKLNLASVECFQVHFDIIEDLIKSDDVETLPAIKGVTLREAVGSYLEKRGLQFDMVDFFIAASQSALQVDMADCYFLAGAELHCKAKQTADSPFSRAGVGSTKSFTSTKSTERRVMYLKRDQSVRQASGSGSSTNGNGGSSSTPPTPTTHRWSSLRSRNTIPSNVKNEPHPLAQAHAQTPSIEICCPPDDEVKGSRSELNIPEASSPHGTLKGNQPLKGIGKLFGVTRKQDQLQECLQVYQRIGLPPMPDLLTIGLQKFDPEICRLENNWTDLVSNNETCNRYQQEAIWELLKTEVAYIRDLELVINLFLACLYNLQSQALLNDVETEKIFSNIADLHQANCRFYQTHMYPVLTMARANKQPLDPTPLIQGFSEFCSYFEPYSKFCIEYMACQLYLSRMKDENELFRMFLNWAENQRECNRLSLRDYIGKPFQRLTKYKLLLERIWREPRPDNVHDVISQVDQFICQVNATVTQLEIMRRIDSYDAVDLPNNDTLAKMVGPFCRLDLTRPIPGTTSKTRFLIEEGTLRMNNRTDVICFLFTDMLLITKATSRKVDAGNKVKVKVYKPPMRLDKIYVNPLPDGGFMLVYLNEYNLATTAYTFHGDHSRLWLERIRQTQDEYEKLKNAIMDQSEAYLVNLANGIEPFEDEFAYMNARSVAMEMGLDRVSVHRQVSVASADIYLGNDGERVEGRRPHSMTGSDLDRLRVASALSVPNYSPNTHPDRSPHESPPNTPLVSNFTPANGANSHPRFQSPQEQQPHYVGMESNANGASPVSKSMNSSNRGQLQHTHSLPLDSAESGGVKLKQYNLPASLASEDLRKLKPRRDRDRRYFTADMIQDLHHGKDASIQKRLSWHSGAKDTDYEYKQSISKHKTVSSDSLRSVHSSSGVSSVGSLHMNPDHEISEESSDAADWVAGTSGSEGESSSQASDITTRAKLHYSKSEPTPNAPHNSITSSPATEIHVTYAGSYAEAEHTPTTSNLTTQGKVSKSMPDISQLKLDDRRDKLVNLIREGQRRKLSDSQSKRLKLQILNSTLEATDV